MGGVQRMLYKYEKKYSTQKFDIATIGVSVLPFKVDLTSPEAAAFFHVSPRTTS